ncbi:MAG: NAD(+) synthase [Planctomycetaceae bacterium]|nr:NAD(+) synthase [Planctomycetaceae bacterium]
MKFIKVAAAALNQTPLAWDTNQTHILQAISEARQQEASILCLPEMCITGYGCEDAFHSSAVQAEAMRVLLEIAPHTAGMIVSLGLPVPHSGGLFNCVCCVADGTIRGFVGKQNLAGEGIHYEPRWFQPWPAGVRVTVQAAGQDYPLGDLLFNCDGVLLGFEICEDAWVAQRPGAELASRGVDIILNPSASHFAFGKNDIRKRFVLEGSRAFHAGYIYVNLLGNEAGRAIYDGGAMIANDGQLKAQGPRFSFSDVCLTTAVLDVDEARMNRTRAGHLQARLEQESAGQVNCPFTFPAASPIPPKPRVAPYDCGPHVKEESFTHAVSLALFDYLRKSHSRGFIVSLSGGADSTAVALLCGTMVQFGTRELGVAAFRDKIAYLQNAEHVDSVDALIGELLTCVYQSTRNSSDTTRSAARSVAASIGATFIEWDVDALVQDYIQLISGALRRDLTWDKDDLALQNIQARVRGPGVWMLANLQGALLLATSNRSEAAVGYATMDGDTCGGLSPIAGIDKAFLRHWLQWMETTGPADLGALPSLSAVTNQQPTAELRPLAAHQTDEADLMPYEVLDAIERAAIRDKHSPAEAWRLLQVHFPNYTPHQLGKWTDRFYRLWCRNQWKRERYAPSFHLDDENLDPKTWCRFPILSGGFERELTQLKELISNDSRE